MKTSTATEPFVMEPTVLLILSDIHFGKLAVSREFATEADPPAHEISNAVSMKASLIYRAKQLKPDAILVTGDLTSIASPAEFAGSVQIVNEIAQALGVRPKNIFYTFGNHDINWRISGLGTANEKFKEDPGYGSIAGRMPGLLVENKQCDVAGPVPGSGIFRRPHFEIVIANTGFHCVHDQAFPHGRLGPEQLEWLRSQLPDERDRAKWLILMLHHHPFNYPYPTPGTDISTLEEGSELVDLIGKTGVDIVCHGHRHHPNIYCEMRDGWVAPVTFFCAGSVAVAEHHRNKGEIPNLFHVVLLENRSSQGAAVGRIESFEYSSGQGWIPARRSPCLPLDPSQRFGSCSTSSDRNESGTSLLRERLGTSQSEWVDLPGFGDLPLPLQCMPASDLKQLLASCAQTLDCSIVGNYPETVYLKRKSV